MTQVPAQYQAMVNDAAKQLGIPASVVAAQLYLESGWDPTIVSPTGAVGLAQFEPGTWASYGSGDPKNPVNAFAAYVKYMKYLLGLEHGDLSKALAAYNAGPGDLRAGAGYASTILKNAGTGDVTVSGGTSTGTSSGTSGTSGTTGTNAGWTDYINPFKYLDQLNPLNVVNDIASSILSVFKPIVDVFGEFYNGFVVAMKAVVWLVNPANWVRIIVGMVGTASLIVGLVFVAKAA